MKKYCLAILTLSLFFIFGFKGKDNQPKTKSRMDNPKSKTENMDAKIVPNTLIIKVKVDPKNALFKGDALDKLALLRKYV